MNELTQQRLKELLQYDPDTGNFFWKVRSNSRANAGDLASKQSFCFGYRQISIDGKTYRAHRLVWFYFHNKWPTHNIDHINGIREDNRIENLRDVTQKVNMQNLQKAKRNSKSGLLGVDWMPKNKKWRAQIRIDGKKVYLGYFVTAQLAHEAYLKAKGNV